MKNNIYILFVGAMVIITAHIVAPDFVNAQNASTHDVTLVSTTPTYTTDAIPWNNGSNDAFDNLQYVPSGSTGYVVAGGFCNNAFVNPVTGTFEDGGQFTFNSRTGAFINKTKACLLVASPSPGCNELGGCNISAQIEPLGNGRFWQGGNVYYGTRRSPAVYNVNPTGASNTQLGRVFFNTGTKSFGDVVDLKEYASANGVFVGVQEKYVDNSGIPHPPFGFSDSELSTTYYQLPTLTPIASDSLPTPSCVGTCSGRPPRTQPTLVPIVGVGEYLLAREGFANNVTGIGNPPIKVYRMPTAEAIVSGDRPVEVQTLSGTLTGGTFVRDTVNPERIILQTSATFGTLSIKSDVYHAGPNGLVHEGKVEDVFGVTLPPTLTANKQFSFFGDSIAYATCKNQNGNTNLNTCRLEVFKDKVKLSVEPLPVGGNGLPQYVKTLTFTPEGKIFVAAGRVATTPSGNLFFTSNPQKIYVYNAFTPGGDDDDNDDDNDNNDDDTPPTGTDIRPDFDFLFNFTSLYMGFLRDLMQGSINTDTARNIGGNSRKAETRDAVGGSGSFTKLLQFLRF